MTQTITSTDQVLLDDIEADASEGSDKSDGTLDSAFLAREAGYLRQHALNQAVQVARVALAHNRITEAHAADFTVSAAGKFLAFLQEQ